MSREAGGRDPSCRGMENALIDKGSASAKALVCSRAARRQT